MKKRSLLLFVFGIIFINLSLTSAAIYFSNIEKTYNLGDRIDVEISVDEILPDYLLTADLICNGKNIIEFNSFPDDDGISIIKLPLNFNTIQEANGECYFIAKYSNQEQKSRTFEISKKLDVVLETIAYFTNPDDSIVVKGTASRLNKEPVNGKIEITIPLLSILSQPVNEESITNNFNSTELTTEEIIEQIKNNTGDAETNTPVADTGTFYGEVINGEFAIPIEFDNDVPAGDYRIDIVVYEEAAGKRTSEGVAMATLKIFQVLTSIDMALNNQNLNPGDSFSFKPTLLDQTGILISDDVSVIIRNEKLGRIFEKIVKSGETVNYVIPTNLTSGYYDAETSSGNFNSTKKFYVNEKAIVSFLINNGTLIVTNIGNIIYNKDIQIEIDEKSFIKRVVLGLGETKEFKLTGSGGKYDVKISDGETEITNSGVLLTGNAVNVDSSGSAGSLALKTPIVWIFLIIILGAGLLFLFRNIFKKKSFAYPFSDRFGNKKFIEFGKQSRTELGKQPRTNNPEISRAKEEYKPSVPGALVAPSQAEQVLVLNGNKNSVALMVLKIKNKIGKQAKLSLEKAIEPVYSKRGAVYEQGDFIYAVFSPLMTRTTKNEILAAKCSEKIMATLKEHNKKFNDKIEFGIAINSGEIINKIENKKLKFTALGNLIPAGKRLADASNMNILVSKQAYEKGISEIKAEKIKINNADVYELRSIVDHEKNEKFVKSFLDRMEKEEKAKKK